jgi:phosphate transport system substrate-binding protein
MRLINSKEELIKNIETLEDHIKEGKNMALDLDYVPMPDATTDFIRKSVWNQVQAK